jgi:hypothetical protein
LNTGIDKTVILWYYSKIVLFKNTETSKEEEMNKGRIFLLGILIAIAVFSISCTKTGDSPKGNTVSNGKSLKETYWIREFESPLTGTVSYYGLVFKDNNAAEELIPSGGLTQKNPVTQKNACEYEYKNGEGRLYRTTKKDYEDTFKEYKQQSVQMGLKMTDQEIMEEVGKSNFSYREFKVSDDELTIGKNAIYKKSTLEELQNKLNGYTGK